MQLAVFKVLSFSSVTANGGQSASSMEGEAIMFEGSIRAGFLAALVLITCTAGAQSAVTNSYDINLSNAVTVNNCSTGEPVALSGTVHVLYSVATDRSGANNFAITAANNLTGSG